MKRIICIALIVIVVMSSVIVINASTVTNSPTLVGAFLPVDDVHISTYYNEGFTHVLQFDATSSTQYNYRYVVMSKYPIVLSNYTSSNFSIYDENYLDSTKAVKIINFEYKTTSHWIGTNTVTYGTENYSMSRSGILYVGSIGDVIDENGSLLYDDPNDSAYVNFVLPEITIAENNDNISINYTNHGSFDNVKVYAYKYDTQNVAWEEGFVGYVENNPTTGQLVLSNQLLEYGSYYGFDFEFIDNGQVIGEYSTRAEFGQGRKYRMLGNDVYIYPVPKPTNVRMELVNIPWEYAGDIINMVILGLEWQLDMSEYDLQIQYKNASDTAFMDFTTEDEGDFEGDGYVQHETFCTLMPNYDFLRVRALDQNDYSRYSDWVTMDMDEDLVYVDESGVDINPSVPNYTDMDITESVGSASNFVQSLGGAFSLFGFIYGVLPQPIPEILTVSVVVMMAWFALRLLRG